MGLKRGKRLRRGVALLEQPGKREKGGGRSDHWDPVRAIVCTFVPISSTDQDVILQHGERLDGHFLFDTDPLLRPEYRFRFKGRIYEQVGITVNRMDADHVWEQNVVDITAHERNPGT